MILPGYKDDADELECRRMLDAIMLEVFTRVDPKRVAIGRMQAPVDHWFGEPMEAITRNMPFMSEDAERDLKSTHGINVARERVRMMAVDIAGEIELSLGFEGDLVYRPYQLLRSDGHRYRLRYSKRIVTT